MTKSEFIADYISRNGSKKICNCCGKERYFPVDYYVNKAVNMKFGWYIRKVCNQCHNIKRNSKKPLEIVRTMKPEPIQNPIAMRRAKEIMERVYGKV